MNKAINLSSEALEMVNRLCDPDYLENRVCVLQAAEDKLQELAYGESEPVNGCNLYDVAYTLKQLCKDLVKLKTLVEDEKGK